MSTRRHSARPDTVEHLLRFGVCEVSGKRGYRSKRDARRARQRHPTDGLHVYRCDDCGGYHIGHLPLLVISGVVSRSAYYDAVRERASRDAA